MSERLDAYLSHRGFGTRSEVRHRIRRGDVTVGGIPCKDPSRHVEGDVAILGDAVETGPDSVTLIMHKPIGYACSHDAREAPLFEELVPQRFQHLPVEPAGRLDRDTSGLIIGTTDGQLIHTLTNPRKKLVKRYRIGYRGRLSAHAVERCAKGMMLEGDPKPTLPARLVLLDAEGGVDRALMYLAEGRYHQVRRMIAALGGEVVQLHRDKIGSLELPADLAPGEARELSEGELRRLLTASELD